MICNPQKVQSNSLFDFHRLQKFAEWLYQYHRHREKTFAYLIIWRRNMFPMQKIILGLNFVIYFEFVNFVDFQMHL